MRKIPIFLGLLLFLSQAHLALGGKILLFMDENQNDHLKAYGLAYWCLGQGMSVEWLLNYRGGSFMMDEHDFIKRKATLMGVSFEVLQESELPALRDVIENNNMESILLEKAPKIAIYAPPFKEPWDDAVMLALTYAEVPYDRLYDREVLLGELYEYDWLHLHHEDFTGQYGKFYASFRNASWYKRRVQECEREAILAGFDSVPQHKGAVAKEIKEYVKKGGFLFAMCSATDTLDIALAADGVDIVPQEIDGTPVDPGCQEKLDFEKTFAFHNFELILDPLVYEHSTIDISEYKESLGPAFDAFTLFEFSAKYDPVPTMLVQNHTFLIKGFMGQTTFFNRDTIKENVVILGDIEETKKVKYIYGTMGDGAFVFYAGHDPEDYQHAVGERPTNLALHKNSPGYRLILNNILFPAAKKQKRKT